MFNLFLHFAAFSSRSTFQRIVQKAIMPKNMSKPAVSAPDGIQDTGTSSFIDSLQ